MDKEWLDGKINSKYGRNYISDNKISKINSGISSLMVGKGADLCSTFTPSLVSNQKSSQILLQIQREEEMRTSFTLCTRIQCALVTDGHFQAGVLVLSFWPL